MDGPTDLVFLAVSEEFLDEPHPEGVGGGLAAEAVGLARGGLARRQQLNSEGLDETMFLSQLEEVVARGHAPAVDLLDLYTGAWNGNVDRFFRDFAY